MNEALRKVRQHPERLILPLEGWKPGTDPEERRWPSRMAEVFAEQYGVPVEPAVADMPRREVVDLARQKYR